jgi:hypothetical protein
VLEHVERRYDIKGPVSEWKSSGVASNERGIAAVLVACSRETFGPVVQTDDITGVRAKHSRVRTGATADIERARAPARNGALQQRIEQPAPGNEPEVAPLDGGEAFEARQRKG